MPTAAPSRAQQFLESADRVLNPFKTVEYDHPGPLRHARSLHTNFKQKIEDTFNVFDGGTSVLNFYQLKKFKQLPSDATEWDRQNRLYATTHTFSHISRPGIFDYLTLGIFRGLHFLFSLSQDIADKSSRDPYTDKLRPGVIVAKVLNFIPYMVLGTLHLIGNGILRHAFSTAMTLIMLPVIGLAHGITSLVRHVMEKRLAKQLKVDEVVGWQRTSQGTSQPVTSTTTLQKALGGKSLRTAKYHGLHYFSSAPDAHHFYQLSNQQNQIFYVPFAHTTLPTGPGTYLDANKKYETAFEALIHPQRNPQEDDANNPYGRKHEYLQLFAQRRAAKRAERQQAAQQHRNAI